MAKSENRRPKMFSMILAVGLGLGSSWVVHKQVGKHAPFEGKVVHINPNRHEKYVSVLLTSEARGIFLKPIPTEKIASLNISPGDMLSREASGVHSSIERSFEYDAISRPSSVSKVPGPQ